MAIPSSSLTGIGIGRIWVVGRKIPGIMRRLGIGREYLQWFVRSHELLLRSRYYAF